MYRLLLVDDDQDVLAINRKFFMHEGYEVQIAQNAMKAIAILQKAKVDCIVLDIMLPGMDGFQACSKMKEITKTPIIFLTGRTAEDDKIKGLLLGADDYVSKPYSLRELSVRIKVIIRRCMEDRENNMILSCSPLTLDLSKHKAYYSGEEIILSNREYELLHLFASQPNRTVTFEEIGKIMWGTYQNTDRRSIMVTVSRLRKKLEIYIGMSEMIESVWSEGYKFVVKQ